MHVTADKIARASPDSQSQGSLNLQNLPVNFFYTLLVRVLYCIVFKLLSVLSHFSAYRRFCHFKGEASYFNWFYIVKFSKISVMFSCKTKKSSSYLRESSILFHREIQCMILCHNNSLQAFMVQFEPVYEFFCPVLFFSLIRAVVGFFPHNFTSSTHIYVVMAKVLYAIGSITLVVSQHFHRKSRVLFLRTF